MKYVIAAFLAIGLFTGCLKGDESQTTCSYNPCGQVAPADEIAQVQSYLTAQGIAATQHCSGLFYVVDDQGTGATPTVCNTIAFSYEGKLTNGNTFDKAESPITYPLSQLITGFKNGIPLIKSGGKVRLFVPPSLGYGSRQAGSIPPNSILVFEVKLVGVQ